MLTVIYVLCRFIIAEETNMQEMSWIVYGDAPMQYFRFLHL